jgi:hypothetical protein
VAVSLNCCDQRFDPPPAVEDDTSRLFLTAWKQGGDTFKAFARERVTVICAAVGPDGSRYCDKIESERQAATKGGLRYLEFYLVMTKEDFSTNSKETSRVGPVYMVDISRPSQPLALMISPRYGTLASRETAEAMRRMVETVRVGEYKGTNLIGSGAPLCLASEV